MTDELPLIDVGPLVDADADHADRLAVAGQVDAACRRHGFFRIVGHGVPAELRDRLYRAAVEFFALPATDKSAIAMSLGGAAWRGWFEVGGELTSGRPDHKEGIYFGAELAADHPAVLAGRPLHGPNLFPQHPVGLRRAVIDWMSAMSALGQQLLNGIALGLGLDGDWFHRHVTADPTTLFRIFHYPPRAGDGAANVSHPAWGVAEHSDYGLLTILAQDGTPGLEVRDRSGWIAVPADPDVFVVNLGDMLDRMTAGRYRSTPHRVRNRAGADRLSFPFFLDPSWDSHCPVMPLAGAAPAADDSAQRWDRASVHAWDGTYGDYLTAKVAKVFPELFADVAGGY